jgi:asparagine synthase (glutamine-hydrolysing)
MCGIAGRYNVDPTHPVSAEVIRRMTDALRHRGPDDEGVWVHGRVGLGNRRLAVIDLSDRGHQPMSNEDGTVWIAYNGEAYGFNELRRELLQLGHAFRSDSDTEVIVHAYEQFGTRCLARLRGMYAFAIWDMRDQSLLLARDRLGKKPLFYFWDGNRLVFASELRALLQDLDVPAEVDPAAIDDYLTYGYVPGPASVFRHVRKLPPGHFLRIAGHRLELSPYWHLSYGHKRHGTEQELTGELLALLDEAVRIRLVSDVPLGALLSGGIDSSAVVALMRRHVTGPLRTFSIGFADARYDELEHARTVARHFDTDHQEFVVRPNAAEFIEPIVWYYGEPFADSSALPSMIVCKLARQHVTVALNGDGGDETFLGYDRYAAARWAELYDRAPRTIVRGAGAAARLLPGGNPKSQIHRVQRFLAALSAEPRRRYASWLSSQFFDGAAKARLYSDDFRARVGGHDSSDVLLRAYDRSDALDFTERTSHVDVQLYLPDDLLVKMDIASMANSLELRSPLLDHRVVEFAASVPRALKLRGGANTKYLLKRAFEGILPQSILRRRKMGFGVPIDAWLRTDLKPMAYEVLLDGRAAARGYFRAPAVRRLLEDHSSGAAHHQYRIWSLLMLELWHRTYLDAPRDALVAPRYDLATVAV